MSNVQIIVTSPSRREVKALAEQYGGTVEHLGFMRWKLTVDVEMEEGAADALIERAKSEFGAVEVER